jgi:DNA invertase Pin-like site-specific DNA recombinase
MRELNDIKPDEIGVYVRVSTDRQTRQKEGSIKTQVQRCMDWLVEKLPRDHL